MRKFQEKHEVLFAVLWIVLYCAVVAPVKGRFGSGSIWLTLVLAAIAAAIAVYVRVNRLEKKYGLDGWPKNMKALLYLIPFFVIATANLWGGISPSYHGASMLWAVLSMALVGYVEEMLFRGFLFRGMLSEEKVAVAVVVSALTFGMGHIINLLTGQGGFQTLMQVIFAVALGFLFTMVALKGGSLIPCILVHSMIDVFARFSTDSEVGDWISFGATVVVSIVYCLYLRRLETPKKT